MAVTAEVNLVTTSFEQGVGKIVGLVGTINSALGRIGEVAIGTALADSIAKISSEMAKLPESVIQSAAKMESSAAGMGSAMEIAAKRSSEAWNQAGIEMDAAVQKAQQGVDKSARAMAQSLEAAAQKAAQFASQMERAAEVASRGFAANNTQFGRSVEDIATRGGQAAEDLSRNVNRAGQDFSRRMTNIEAETGQRVGNIMGSFNDAAGERSRVFQQGLGNIEFGLQESGIRIANSQANVMSSFGNQVENIRSGTADKISSINEAFSETAHKIGQAMSDENEKFQEGLEIREAAYQDSTSKLALAHEDTMEGLEDNWEKVTKHSADAAQKISRQVADAMTALRHEEEKANLEFSRKMADLSEEELMGPKTQEETNQIAKKKVRLGADLALNQQSIDQRKAQVAKQAQNARDDLAKQTEEQQAAILKRMAKEEELYQRRQAFLDAQHERETLKATLNHERVIRQLEERLEKEERARDRAIKKAEAEGEKAERNAEKQAARQLANLEAQKAAEERQADHQRKNLEENFAAQEILARKALDRQLKDVQANAERQRQAAQIQLDRAVEDANRGHERVTQHLEKENQRAQEDHDTTADNIQDKWDETNKNIEQAAANSARQSAIDYEKMGDSFNDAVKKLSDAIDEFYSTHSNKAVQVAQMFSKAWVDSFNKVQAEMGNLTRLEFIDPNDPDKFQKQAKQLINVAKDMSVSMGKDANDVQDSMTALALSNLDPLQNDILKTTAAMSTLPQVVGGMKQVVTAFGALATGQLGEANQRFREFGVNLKDVPGLVFDANGKIVANSEQTTAALAKAMGKTTQQILHDFPDSAQRVLQLVEITFRDRYKGVLEAWLQTSEGQFAQAKAIFNNFKLDIGQAFLEVMKGPLGEFVKFLKDRQGEIGEIGRFIGVEMANLATYVIDGIKRLSEADTVTAFKDFLNALGHLKDSIITTISGISTALAGGGVDFGGALAAGIEGFAKLIETAAQTLRDTDFEAVADKIIKAFERISKQAGAGGGSVEEFFGAIFSGIGNIVSIILENGDTIVKFFQDLFKGIEELIKFTMAHGDELKQIAIALIGLKVSSEIIFFIANLADAFGKLGTAIGDIINFFKAGGPLGTLFNKFGTAIDKILGVMGRFGAALRGPILAALLKIGTISPGVVTAFNAIATAIGGLATAVTIGASVLTGIGLGAIISKIIENITGIQTITPVMEGLGVLLPALGRKFGLFKDAAENAPDKNPIENFVDGIKKKLGTLFDAPTAHAGGLEDFGSQIATSIKSGEPEITEALTNLRDSLRGTLEGMNTDEALIAKLNGFGHAVAQALADGVSPSDIDPFIENINNALVTALENTGEVSSEEASKVAKNVLIALSSGAIGEARQRMREFGLNLDDSLRAGLDPLAGTAAGSSQAVIDSIDKVLQDGSSSTAEDVDTVVNGIKVALDKLPGVTQGPIQQVLYGFKEIPKEAEATKNDLQSPLDGISKGVEEAFKPVGDAVAGVGNKFSELGTNVDTALTTAKTTVATFVSDVGSTFDKLGTTIDQSEAWQTFKQQFSSAFESVNYLVQEFIKFEELLLRIGGKALSAFGSQIDEHISKPIQKAIEDLSNIGKAFDRIGEDIAQSGAAAAIEEFKNRVIHEFEGAKREIERLAADVGKVFSGIGKSASESGVAVEIGAVFESVGTTMRTKIDGLITDIERIPAGLDKAGTDIANSGAANIMGAIGKVIQLGVDEVIKVFQGMKDGIPVILEGLGADLKVAFDNFTTFMTGWVAGIPGVIGGLYDILLKALVQPFINIYFQIKKALLAISGESLIDDWFVELTKNLPEWMEKAIGALIDEVEECFKKLYKIIEEKFNEIKKAIEDGIAEAFKIFGEIANNIKDHLETVKKTIGEWAKSLIDAMKEYLNPEVVGKIIADTFGGLKDKVMGFLHELHGSGEIGPWLDSLHDTMVQGFEKIVADSAEGITGLSEPFLDEVGAMTNEGTLFFASFSEGTNQLVKDFSNIAGTISAGGGAAMGKFAALLTKDTGPAGGQAASGSGSGSGARGGSGGEGGPYGFKSTEAYLNAWEKSGMTGDQFRMSIAPVPKEVQESHARFQKALKEEEARRQKILADYEKGQEAQRKAGEEAIKRDEEKWAKLKGNVSETGQKLTGTTNAVNDAQKKNFENLTKGISGGMAAWTGAAQSVNQGMEAWSNTAKNISQVATTISSIPTPVNYAPTPGNYGSQNISPEDVTYNDNMNFAVNVSTINVQNGEAIDFMQTYVDQYATLLNPGANL